MEDTVFAAFIFEDCILSTARRWLHATNPEFIDVDKDLSKCKIVFPLFLGNELHHVRVQASNTCILRASSTILYISHKILISLYRRHELWLSIPLSGND